MTVLATCFRIALPSTRRALGPLILCAALLFSATSLAQQPEASSPQAIPQAIAPHARLMAARTIYIEHSGGSIPNDVIGEAFEGWGHFAIVYQREKADLIVSIMAPLSDSGVSVSGGNNTPSRNMSAASVTQVRMVVRDAHDGVTLWTGGEQPKGSMKEKQREDNEVEASLRLFRRFRAVIEPEPAP
jgi:hypothetical protein